jgi:oligopeptide transport system substrate-binding protein
LSIASLVGFGCSDSQPGSSAGGSGATDGEGGSALKVLRIHRSSEHKTLDPMKQFDQASAEIITNVYDTLLEYHYLTRPYELVPGLLAKMPEKQADGVTQIFTLKRGVHFVDDPAFPDGKGREVDADDAIYTIKRFADANVNIKSYILIQGAVVGLDDFRDQTRKAGKATNYDELEIEGVKKLGTHEFSIRFAGPNPLALYPFAASSFSVVPREAVEHYGDEFENHPVGTGPFTIKKFDRRGTMVLAKNPNYHGRYPTRGAPGDEEAGLLASAGQPLPLIDEIHLPLIEEPQPAMLRFRKGEIDLIGIDKDNFARMASRDDDGTFKLKPPYDEQLLFYVEPRLSCEYIAFNMKDEIVGKNKALRQAIAYALDVEPYIEILLNGRALPLKTVVPHPIKGSENDIDVTYYRHDLEKAKQKLVEAGYPGGEGLPPIHFEYRNTSKDVRQGFEFIRNELSAIGIVAVANFQTFSAYLKRIESGNFQVGGSGWAADYPDAENFYQLLYSENKTPGPNMSVFADAEYDRLYLESRFMENGPERFAKFKRMAEIIRDEVPIILRYNSLAFGLYHPHLKNVKRNMMIDAPYRFFDITK